MKVPYDHLENGAENDTGRFCEKFWFGHTGE
jgi:hypothetical protein